MRKILALGVVAALAIVTVPAIEAETLEADYTGSAGYFLGPVPKLTPEGVPSGKGLAFRTTVPLSAADESLENVNIGGAHFEGTDVATNLVVEILDEAWGTNGALSSCFWNPDGATASICDAEDYQSEWTCGSVSLLDSPFPSNEATTWVITVLVTEALDVCGAAAGTLTADLF